MKIKFLKIKNFRGYRDEVIIAFDNLTAFVGKNDIGKSSILEALDIFFYDGKDIIKIDKTDLNVDARTMERMKSALQSALMTFPNLYALMLRTKPLWKKNTYLMRKVYSK